MEERNREEGEWERKGGIGEKRGGKQKDKGETERERLFVVPLFLQTLYSQSGSYILCSADV